ncbi:MAG: SPOR domain-containing protein [Bacteroidaceae bacterium]|nr:SPOR domain-containing protein [Bacteroidaceae bacterium]
MITLAKHIELLLIEHDCVIVPGLGGFIANHVDAQYTEGEEHLFLPPYRTIGFNQQLQMNDGLLVQSYMTAYETSYPFANLQMEKDVEKLLYELDMNGEYTFENIGVIRKDLNQNFIFTALQSGVLTPSLYGLYSYEMKSLQQVVKEKEIAQHLQATSPMRIAKESEEDTKSPRTKSKTKDLVIHINRHWLDFGISAAAAILLFFCFSYPTMRNANGESDTVVAAFTPGSRTVLQSQPVTVEHQTTAAQSVETPATQAKEISETEPANEVAETASEPAENTPAASEPSTTKYTIVLASYVNQTNAEGFIQRLGDEGLKEGRFVKNGKTSRILYSEYASEADARSALNSLRQQNSAFESAWILPLEK